MQDQNNLEEQDQPLIQPFTKLEILNQRYYFHDKIKETKNTAHYIVEDLSDEIQYQEDDDQIFFYMKQMFFNNYNKFTQAKSYYIKVYNYCNQIFCKKEMIQMSQIFEYVDKEESYFELVLLFKYGETDRIDIEKIENQHINQFLYSICALLQDLKDNAGICHNNISIKNIVLIDRQLKLSGFKPLIQNEIKSNWKIDLSKEFSNYRLDLYLVGLLWLKFYNIKIDSLVENQFSFQKVRDNIDSLIISLPKEKKTDLIEQLLDLTNFPDLTIEKVLLQFNENYIMEILIHDKAVAKNQSPSIENNLFRSPFRESEANLVRLAHDEKNSLPDDDKFKFYGVDFTLKNQSVTPEEEKKQIQDLISIKDEEDGNNYKFDFNNQVQTDKSGNRRSVDPYYDKVKDMQMQRVNSDRKLISMVKSGSNPFKRLKKQLLENEGNNQPLQTISEESNQKQQFIQVLHASPSFKQPPVPLIQKPKDSPKHQKNNKFNQVEEIKEKIQDDNLIKHSIREILGIMESTRKVEEDENDKKIIEPKKIESKKNLTKKKESKKNLNLQKPKSRKELMKEFYQDLKQELYDSKKPKIDDEQQYSSRRLSSKRNLSNEQNSKKILDQIDQIDNYQKEKVFQKQPDQKQEIIEIKQKENIIEEKPQQIINEEKPQQIHNEEIPQQIHIEQEQQNDFIIPEPKILEEKQQQDIFQSEKIIPEQIIQQNIQQQKPKLTEEIKQKLIYSQREHVKNNDEKIQQIDSDTKLELPTQKSRPKKISQKKTKKIKSEKSRSKSQQQINDLLPSSQQHIQNRNINKKNIGSIVQIKQDESEEEKTIDDKIQDLIEKKLVNRQLVSTQKIKYEKLDLQNQRPISKNNDNQNQRNKGRKSAMLYRDQKKEEKQIKNKNNKSMIVKKSKNYQKPSERKIGVQKIKKYDSAVIKNYDNFNNNPNFQRQLFKKTLLSSRRIKNDNYDYSQSYSNVKSSNKKNKQNQETQKNSINPSDSLSQISMMVKQIQNIDQDKSKRQISKDFKNNSQKQKSRSKSISQEIQPKTQKIEPKNVSYFILNEKQNMQLDYDETIKKFRLLLQNKKLVNALQLLDLIIEKESGENKINTLNILSDFYTQNNHLDKALMTLHSTINYVKNCEEPLKSKFLPNLIFKRALLYQKLQRVYEAQIELSNKIFKDEINQPQNYWTVYGDCLFKEQKFPEALKCYKNQLNKLYKQLYDQKNIDLILIHFNKAFLCIFELNNFKEFEKFLDQVLKQTEKIQDTINDLKTGGIIKKEIIFLNVLQLAHYKKNLKIMYELIRIFICLEKIEIKEFNDDQKQKLFEILFSQIQLLKEMPQLKDYKKVYPELLVFLNQLSEEFNEDLELAKSQLLIKFNQGVYLVQQQQMEESKNKFDECLTLYKTKFKQVDMDMLRILYNMGENIEKLNLLNFSIYFFEKVYQLCDNSLLKQKTQIKLAKIHFKLSEFKKSFVYIAPIVSSFFNQNQFLEKIEIISIFFLNCVKLHDTSYKKILIELQQFINSTNDNLLHHYGLMFNKIFGTKYFRNNPNYNVEFQNKLSKIIKVKKLKTFSQKFISFFEEQYKTHLIQQKNSKDSIYSCLLNSSKNNNLNGQIIREFLIQFYFIMEIGTKFSIDQNQKPEKIQNVFNNVKFLKNSKNLLQAITVKIIQSPEKGKHQHSFYKVNLFKKTPQSMRTVSKNLESKKSISEKNIIKEEQEPEMWDHELIKNVPKIEEQDVCVCWDFNSKNKILVSEIHAFFHQIKKHLYQDNDIDFNGFFKSFEKHLQVMNLNLLKYIYLKQIINFQTQQKEIKFFNEPKYFQVFDEIFQNKQICEHDMKNMMLLQEAFLDSRYSQNFIRFIEKKFPKDKKDIYEELIISNLFRKHEKYQKKITLATENKKRLLVLQNPFYKFFTGKELESKIKINLKLNHYNKHRYDVHSQKSLEEMFQKLFGNQFVEFLLKLNAVKTINQLMFYNTSSYKVIKLYTDRLMSIIVNTRNIDDYFNFILVDLYLIFNLIDFNNDPQNIDKLIIQILFLIEEKLSLKNLYLFAFIVNKIGNLFFAQGSIQLCNKCKSISFETMKKIEGFNEKNLYEGFNFVYPEEILFEIFSYFYMIQIDQNQKELANKCLNQVQSFNLQNQYQDNLQKLLNFYHMYKFGENEALNIELKNFELWKKLEEGSIERAIICYLRMGIYGLNEHIFEDIIDKGQKKLIEALDTNQ